tara:strand:- start:1086 stop:1364 length:279 start_codon:yes stop_codon:yes gene_type:complete
MASIKRAYGICDVCGFRYKRKQLKSNSYGLLVCPTDYEGRYDLKNHPQNGSAKVLDKEFIRDPRIETGGGIQIVWENNSSVWEEISNNWNAL